MSSRGSRDAIVGPGGVLFLGPLLMIVFKNNYPWWWFDWNVELQRSPGVFRNRGSQAQPQAAFLEVPPR